MMLVTRKTAIPEIISRLAILVSVTLALVTFEDAFAQTEDLGGGFLHHGVATPISNHRGIVAAVDGQAGNVVLAWRGCTIIVAVTHC